MGTQFPLPQGAQPPQFVAHICCGQMAGRMKMPFGMEVCLGQGNFALDGDPAPRAQKGAEPPRQFSADVYCGQTAGWIKMALGMAVGLGPGHVVLDGDPTPLSKKRGRAPNFRPISVVAKWLDASRWHLVWRQASAQVTVLDGDPASPPQKWAEPSNFVRCLLWPNSWMDQDATSYGGRPWPRRHCARSGPSSSTKKGTAPYFRPMSNVCCGQMAVCIRIPLGTEVGLSLDDIVLDGDP